MGNVLACDDFAVVQFLLLLNNGRFTQGVGHSKIVFPHWNLMDLFRDIKFRLCVLEGQEFIDFFIGALLGIGGNGDLCALFAFEGRHPGTTIDT